jgi:membrane-bound lytic murein transglycosylase B
MPMAPFPLPPAVARPARPARRARLAAVALVVACLAPTAAAPTAGAARDPAGSPPTAANPTPASLALPAPDLADLPDVAGELIAVEVDGAEYRQAAGRYAATDAARSRARDARLAMDRERTALVGTEARARLAHAAASARSHAAERRLSAVEGAVQELVVSRYVDGAGNDRLQAALADPSPSVHDAERRAVLATASLETLLAERAAYTTLADAARAEAAAAAGGRAEALARLREVGAQRPAAVDEEVARGEDLAARRVAYEQARVLATVRGVQFPLVALDAYWRAAAHIAEEQPGCGLGWWALAGISRVEGRHGTYGGSSLDPFGQTTRPIIGIPLDGTNNTRAIPDTDGGELDGDPVWDRAVGPMQFIPSTWRMYRADGNGNGRTDPHNLYDATLAAARYLCRVSGGLDGDDGLRRAFFAYNNSVAYVEQVLGLARGYQVAVEIPPPPQA